MSPRRRAPTAEGPGPLVADRPPVAAPHPPDPRVSAAAERILTALLGADLTLVFVLDAAGVVLAHNRALSDRLGAPPERVQGSCVFDWFPPPVAALRRARLADAVRTGRVQTYADTNRGRHFEHTIVPVPEPDGAYVFFVVIVQDVTARHVAEDRLADALQSGEVGFWEHDLETGRSVFNEEYLLALGYDAVERDVLTRDIRPLFHPDDLGGMLDNLARYRRGEQAAHERESRLRTRQGEYRWVISRGRVTERDDAGRPVRIAGTYRDVTDRKEAEAEQRRLEQQLQQAQKMESLGRLAGGIAHDLNNLLTPVLGYAELVLAEPALDPRTRARLQAITTAARGAGDLATRLLAYGRKQVLDLRPADLNRVVLDFHAMIGRILGEDVRVELDLDPCLPGVLADATQIHQILMNLVVNARDAMPGGGAVRLSTRGLDLGPEEARRHPGLRPGSHVALSVADTGTGMDADTLSHLFEPFFTTKDRGKGTGLGLSTVWYLVRQHGGGVEVSSAPGQGTTVRVLVPVADPTNVPVPPDEVPRSLPSRRATVLVAEDEPVVRALVVDALEAEGYRVLAAPDGLAALRVAEAHGGPLDLLVTDVIMPGLNGRALRERLAEARPGLPVVYMSGYDDEVLSRQGCLPKGTIWLPKPFTVTALLAKVREALDE